MNLKAPRVNLRVIFFRALHSWKALCTLITYQNREIFFMAHIITNLIL